jgi:hypothetical protein
MKVMCEHRSNDDVGVAIRGALWRTQTIDNRRARVCITYIDKLVYALRGHFMKASNVII